MPTPEDDDATEAAAAAESSDAAEASAEASEVVEEDGADGDELEISEPPALIVRVRTPDRAASRTVGVPTPVHAGPGVEVTFGLSVAGRLAERSARTQRVVPRVRENVLRLPHPELSSLPTRVVTANSFDADPDER